MNVYAVMMKRASSSCASLMLGEKKRCPVVRQLHLAAAIAEVEPEPPVPVTFSSPDRSRQKITKKEEADIMSMFEELLSSGGAMKSLGAFSETVVSPRPGLRRQPGVRRRKRASLSAHDNPIHQSNTESNQSHDFMKSSGKSSEKTQPFVRSAVLENSNANFIVRIFPDKSCTRINSERRTLLSISGRESPVLLSDLISNDSQSDQFQDHMQNLGTFFEKTQPFVRPAVLEDSNANLTVRIFPHKSRIRRIDTERRTSLSISGRESPLLLSDLQSNDSQSDQSQDHMQSLGTRENRSLVRFHAATAKAKIKYYYVKSLDTFLRKNRPLLRFHIVGRNDEDHSISISGRESPVLLSDLQFNDSQSDQSQDHMESLGTFSGENTSLVRFHVGESKRENHPISIPPREPLIECYIPKDDNNYPVASLDADPFASSQTIISQTVRWNTDQHMETDFRRRRGKKDRKIILIDNAIESSLEEMEYVQANQTAQQGSNMVFIPEQPTMEGLSRMTPTLTVGMQEMNENVLEQLRPINLEEEQVADRSGRYDLPETIETAITPQLYNTQYLASDEGQDTLSHAERLAIRNGSFRPSDQQNFLRIMQNLLSADKKSLPLLEEGGRTRNNERQRAVAEA